MKKRNKIIYWVSTVWLALGMLATGIQQLMKAQLEEALAPPGVYGIKQLGYPVYFLTIIGIWKILGVVALLIPKFPLQRVGLCRFSFSFYGRNFFAHSCGPFRERINSCGVFINPDRRIVVLQAC